MGNGRFEKMIQYHKGEFECRKMHCNKVKNPNRIGAGSSHDESGQKNRKEKGD